MRSRRRVAGLLAGLLLTAAAAAATDIVGLRVENLGEGALDTESVLAYTSQKVGDEFSRSAVARDVKALEESGRYAYIGVNVEQAVGGVDVVFQVRSKPRLRDLRVDGADYLGASKVRKLMDIDPGVPIDDGVLAVAVQKVRERYRKRHFPYAKIAWEIDEEPGTDLADVTVRIKEGARGKIGRITFSGNDAADSGALRKVMQQRQANWLSFITKAGTYDPHELDLDVYAIRQFYLDRGYLDVQVGTPEVTTGKRNRLRITIPIEEGRVYHITSVDLAGVTLFPQDEVQSEIKIRAGDIASLGEIRASARAVRDYYGSRGYIRTAVKDELDTDRDAATVGVRYSLTEGRLAHIGRIDIQGNVRTKDKVIRRELAVFPGDVFNDVKIQRSERRLRNLGYFSTVFSTPQPTDEPDIYDLKFEVEEKKTGQFVVGAGFSSVDDLIGFVELSQGNFDIANWPNFTGGGQKMKVRAQLGTSRTDVEFSFTEPWFLDRRLSLGLSLFQNERRFLSDEYDQRNTGGSVSLGKSLGGYNRARLRYTLQNIDVFNVDDNASDIIKAEAGSRAKSSVGLELIHDSRNSPFVPSRGTRASVEGTLAGGPVGGATDIYTVGSQLSQYWTLWFDHVFSVRGQVGFVEEYGDSDRVPIFDREFLGGARTLRGFKYRDVGPKDETGETIGGRTSWFASGEYTLPVVEKVRLAAFYDIGQVYEDAFEFSVRDYNSDYGFGVRLDLPQFPLRLDYAWPLKADEFNDRSSGRFNFLIGYVF